jgi:hypothetical protein
MIELLLEILAVVFLAWGAYSSYTSGQWVAGLPLILLGLLLFVWLPAPRDVAVSSGGPAFA